MSEQGHGDAAPEKVPPWRAARRPCATADSHGPHPGAGLPDAAQPATPSNAPIAERLREGEEG